MYITVDFARLTTELQHGVRTVLFRKLDGTLREMRCTLQADVVPAVKGSNARRSDAVFTVYDVEQQGWRCFNKQRVVAIW